MTYDEKWYFVELSDGFEADSVKEPEWDKVPIAKLDAVRKGYEAARAQKLQPQRVKLWGPQIEWYQRQPKYRVQVVEVCDPV